MVFTEGLHSLVQPSATVTGGEGWRKARAGALVLPRTQACLSRRCKVSAYQRLGPVTGAGVILSALAMPCNRMQHAAGYLTNTLPVHSPFHVQEPDSS